MNGKLERMGDILNCRINGLIVKGWSIGIVRRVVVME